MRTDRRLLGRSCARQVYDPVAVQRDVAEGKNFLQATELFGLLVIFQQLLKPFSKRHYNIFDLRFVHFACNQVKSNYRIISSIRSPQQRSVGRAL